MKRTSIISLLICFITLGAMTTSCEDMLSPDSERHSYKPAQDTLYSYWGIIKSLQNVAERYVVLGECRGELVDGTSYVSDSIAAILNFDMAKATDGSCRFLRASDYYHVINSCNAYLAYCDRERTTGTLQPYMLREAAQVEAIRAWTYLQLVQVYGEVPFYTEPLLTTDDITAFAKNHPTVTADNLIDQLLPFLKQALDVELSDKGGMPQYNWYGEENARVCHSSKTMIPLNLILGDLYLTKGDKASCEIAAQYYYDYLSNNQGHGHVVPGGTLPETNYAYGYKADGMDRPEYFYIGSAPWTETGAVSSTSESITAIPSSTSKLWGTVLRGVNELYGYASEISVSTDQTSDTTSTTTASILLTAKYDVKQLAASEAYYKLCKEQTYEVMTGPANSSLDQLEVTADTVVGDARQYWVRYVRQEYSNGMTNNERFIVKQNPYGFTTVAHMIYRKSMVWLRFAEALNRAGYPSYAFAILKNGLCNNDSWYPTANSSDYAVRDSAWAFTTEAKDTIPADWKQGTCPTREELDNLLAALVENGDLTEDDIAAGGFTWKALSYENYPDENCSATLYYLDQREVKRSPSFLNFTFETLNGNLSSETYYSRTSLIDNNFGMNSISVDGNQKITKGIHSKGCGYIPLAKQHLSSYNYEDKVAEKAKAYGYTLTKEDIYSGEYDDIVQNAVEDLIVDEEAMELAFEGTRFFDLMRVAHRRGDANYLASRVARRDPSLLGKLQNSKNWYFPLPQ